MSRTSPNLGLALPLKKELFNINTWNSNMLILDEAYALLTDPSGGSRPITANIVQYDNSTSGLDATNLQQAVDEIVGMTIDSNVQEITVTEDMTITIPTWEHAYIILHFGGTVYDVDFEQSASSSGIDFVWEGGEPTFQANSTYELSFLKLDCMWFKR